MLPKPIVYRGKTYSSKAELCREFGMGVATLNYRLRSGCTVEEAVEKELDTGVKVVFQGTEYPSIKALAKELDLPYSRLSHYYGRSRDIDQSVERCRREAGQGVELWGKQYRGIPEVAMDFGVRYASLVQRLRDGMELPEAVRHLLRSEGVTFAGKKYENFVDLCGEYHMQPANVYGRLNLGFTLTEALTRPLGKAGHGNAMWYEGVAYDSQRALCQAYGISVDCVREQTKRHPFSFLDSFENLKRLKEYAGMPWGEEMNYIPACRVRGKNYKTAASFVRQFGITSSMLSAYKYKRGYGICLRRCGLCRRRQGRHIFWRESRYLIRIFESAIPRHRLTGCAFRRFLSPAIRDFKGLTLKRDVWTFWLPMRIWWTSLKTGRNSNRSRWT